MLTKSYDRHMKSLELEELSFNLRKGKLIVKWFIELMHIIIKTAE